VADGVPLLVTLIYYEARMAVDNDGRLWIAVGGGGGAGDGDNWAARPMAANAGIRPAMRVGAFAASTSSPPRRWRPPSSSPQPSPHGRDDPDHQS
jgi:hypothetical protein